MKRVACLVACVLSWVAAAVADEPKDGPMDAKAAFVRLKALEGEWNSVGEPAGKVVYRVTAAGSALVEELFPETSHSMVSVYHLDGDALKMTHYCAAGNQPHMKLDLAKSTPEKFVFAFDGGTNFDPEKDAHMHEQVYTMPDADTLTAEWIGYREGKPEGESLVVTMKRK